MSGKGEGKKIFPPFDRYLSNIVYHYNFIMIIKINTGCPEGKDERTIKCTNKPSFLKLAHRQVRQMEGVRCPSTIGNYKTALRSLERFLTISGKAEATLSRKLVVRYDCWLDEEGVSRNTRSCYLRSLRALYNRVEGSRRHIDLFADVFTGNAPTPKRAISVAEIRRVRSLDVGDDWQRQLAQDVFLFSLYAMGMPFVDIAMLRQNAIAGGCLTYRRQKTGAQVCVRLEPCMRKILQRWRGMNGDRLFPLVPHEAKGEEAMRFYRAALSRYNRLLRQMASQAGLHKTLSSYVARHSWATLAYDKGVAMSDISVAMGHTNVQTTKIYIEQKNQMRVARANRKVLGVINEDHSVGAGKRPARAKPLAKRYASTTQET